MACMRFITCRVLVVGICAGDDDEDDGGDCAADYTDKALEKVCKYILIITMRHIQFLLGGGIVSGCHPCLFL